MAEYNYRKFEKPCEDKALKMKSSCFFSEVGCRFKGGRAKLQEHEAESVRQHLHLLMEELTKLNHKASPAILPPDTSRTLVQLERETESLQTRVKVLQRDHGISEICRTLRELCKLTETAEECVASVETRLAAFQNKHHAVSQKIDKCSRMAATLQRQTRCHDQLLAGIEYQLTVLQSRMHRTDQAIQVRTAKVTALESMTHCGVFIWRIPQIQERFQEAIDGTNPYLDSSEFYFSTYSYKMCLRIYLNGHEDWKGTHISLYYILLKGDYDALTQWPFKEKVKLALLNARDRQQSILRICVPSDQDPASQRPVEGMNTPHGFHMFMALPEFHQCFSELVDSEEMFVGAEIVPANVPS
ncbi:TNF receptor-associated factor 1-like [Leucoraja erinacea]|uniref:TNF receptor-associated factor 1-like n=1 Tax=Leucoraja erinaceus TaxID=7782 RepID=UPI0024561A5D|nr:TNF receptor-associated factor 1-like [Leucoraja erinacea]